MKKGFSKKDIENMLSKLKTKHTPAMIKSLQKRQSLEELRGAWEKCVIPILAEHTIISAFRDGVLTVNTDHGIYAQQIQMQSNEILASMRKITSYEISKLDIKTKTLYWKNGKRTDIMSQKSKVVSISEHPNHKKLDELIAKLKQS